ncbi:MAG: TetR/AcrR family transcriptional regulator [Chloroflexi bacterium]|nr:TetR/AcrR family transcriptional regulator [Chloroflexota bacterium]
MTTTSEPEQGIRKPGRPRSAQAHKAIIEATLELLAEEGYQGLSIEAVAARAGVGKTTIYRRWSSKEELVMEAIRHVQLDIPVIDTGNFRNDLAAILKTASQGIMAYPYPFLGKLVLKLLGEYQTNPEIFQGALTQLILPRFQRFFHMVEQAQARKEIRGDLDPELVMGLVAGSLYFHWIVMRHLLPTSSTSLADWIEQVIDAIMQGIATK